MTKKRPKTEQSGGEPSISKSTRPIGFVFDESASSARAEPDNPMIFDNSSIDKLRSWHNLNSSVYLDLVRNQPIPWPVPMYDNRHQLTYLIVTTKRERLPDHGLEDLLVEVAQGVGNVVNTGWSMFYPFKSFENIRKSPFRPEGPGGSGEDVYEQNLITPPHLTRGLPDFWRIALDGRATIVRMYAEDRMQADIGGNPVPDRWLDPETVIRDTTEIITHARLLAQRFPSAVGVGFSFDWKGLKNRCLHSMNPAISWSFSRIRSSGNSRFIEDRFWTLPELESDWTTVVAELSAPVLRLFNFTGCTPELVERIAPRFIKL